jgi:hypothetical protein
MVTIVDMPKKTKLLEGKTWLPDEPNWDPLGRAASAWLLEQFMAMHEVDLQNGVRVCCYKHIDTRRSLHLDADLNAYLYSFDERNLDHPGHYEQVPLREAFGLVVLQPEFADGWYERGRFDRPPAVDDDGNEIEDNDFYEVGPFEEHLTLQRWRRRHEPGE